MAGCSWWMLFLPCSFALQPLYCLDNRNKAFHQLMVWLTSVIRCSSPGANGLSIAHAITQEETAPPGTYRGL